VPAGWLRKAAAGCTQSKVPSVLTSRRPELSWLAFSNELDEKTKSMSRRKPILWIAAVLLMAVPLALFLRKPAPLDLSKDEEPFRLMVLPPKSVTGDIIMDGGSVVEDLNDGANKTYEIFFEIDYTTRGHPTASWRPGKVGKRIPLKDPTRAKAISKSFLRSYGKTGDEGVGRALNGLSAIVET
jgi:hypothetical protein